MRDLQEKDIKEKLVKNNPLFKDVHIIKQKFDILPADREHYGVNIDYQDIKLLRIRKGYVEIELADGSSVSLSTDEEIEIGCMG